MSATIVINTTGVETRVALVENGQITEYYLERKKDKGIVGNIYKGRVVRVLPGMQAAFVDIGLEKAAFLYVSDVFYDPEFSEQQFDLTEGEHEEIEDIPDSPEEREEPEGQHEPMMLEGGEERSEGDAPEEGAALAEPSQFDEPAPESQELPEGAGEPADAPAVELVAEPTTEPANEVTPASPGDIDLEAAKGAPEVAAPPTDESGAPVAEGASEVKPEEAVTGAAGERKGGERGERGELRARGRNRRRQQSRREGRGQQEGQERGRKGEREEREEREERNGRDKTQQKKMANIQDLLQVGQEIIVQVAKDPMGTKGARVTSHISIPGRHLVLMPTIDHIGTSRRIERESERRRLREIIDRVRPPGTGFIIRTVAEDTPTEKLEADARFLIGIWNAVGAKKDRTGAPALLHPDLDLALRATRDLFAKDVEKLVIDDRAEWERIQAFVEAQDPALKDRVVLHDSIDPIFDAYGIEHELQRAQARKVWLKSGGYLIIDQAEALTAIDVNSGRYVGKKSLEETITKINIEASKEIVYQLRLRNIGGIIIIDFIDMDKSQNRDKVFKSLQDALGREKAKTNVLKISELGLVEMTRKRVRESLGRTLFEPCSACEGRGHLKSKRTVAYEIFRQIRREASHHRDGQVVINCNPEIARVLQSEERDELRSLMDRFNKSIHVRPQPSYAQDQYDLFGKGERQQQGQQAQQGQQQQQQQQRRERAEGGRPEQSRGEGRQGGQRGDGRDRSNRRDQHRRDQRERRQERDGAGAKGGEQQQAQPQSKSVVADLPGQEHAPERESLPIAHEQAGAPQKEEARPHEERIEQKPE